MEVIQTTSSGVKFGPPLEITEHDGERTSSNDRVRFRTPAHASVTHQVIDAYMAGTIGKGVMTDFLSKWQAGIDIVIPADRNLHELTMDLQKVGYHLQRGTFGASETSDLVEAIKAERDELREAEASLNTLSHTIMEELVRRQTTLTGVIEPSMTTAYTIVSGEFRGYNATLVNWSKDEYGRMTSATVQLFTDTVKVAGMPWFVTVRADQLAVGFLDLDDNAPGDLVQIILGAFRGVPARVRSVDEDEVTVELTEAVVPVAITLRADQLLPTHRVDRVDDVDDDETGGFEGLGSLFG
jgi:hypothetical protein